jgi:prepilin-type N-terminal cleavage/methylation domain-containing protein
MIATLRRTGMTENPLENEDRCDGWRACNIENAEEPKITRSKHQEQAPKWDKATWDKATLGGFRARSGMVASGSIIAGHSGTGSLDGRGLVCADTPAPAGFAAIEMLAVVAVIGILTALLLPAVKAARQPTVQSTRISSGSPSTATSAAPRQCPKGSTCSSSTSSKPLSPTSLVQLRIEAEIHDPEGMNFMIQIAVFLDILISCIPRSEVIC